jgi:hypothetical protein
MTNAIADGLAKIERIRASAPMLTDVQRADYERICARVHRASATLRRATKKVDAKAIAAAERSLAKARAQRDAFVAPLLVGFNAPERIRVTCSAAWTAQGNSGIHVHEIECILDHVDIGGPEYKRVAVISESGRPPFEGARGAPDSYGVAWFALKEYIASGKIMVL